MEQHTANLNNIDIHYVTEGTGPVILFLHGFPEFWYAWKDQLAAFSATHTAVAADLPGYNLSGKPDDVSAYAMPNLVATLKSLIDHLSNGIPIVLVGHDWGGIISWAFAAYYPEYISRLVIINAPHPATLARELATNPAQQKAISYTALLRSPQAEGALTAGNFARLNASLFDAARPDSFTDEDRAAYQEAWSQPGAINGLLSYYRASASPTEAPALPPVLVPTLVIWGEADTAMLTGNLDGLDEFVPDLQVLRIPQGTHWVVHEEGEQITNAIRSFIAPPTP